jgi:hypothetical protein
VRPLEAPVQIIWHGIECAYAVGEQRMEDRRRSGIAMYLVLGPNVRALLEKALKHSELVVMRRYVQRSKTLCADG